MILALEKQLSGFGKTNISSEESKKCACKLHRNSCDYGKVEGEKGRKRKKVVLTFYTNVLCISCPVYLTLRLFQVVVVDNYSDLQCGV